MPGVGERVGTSQAPERFMHSDGVDTSVVLDEGGHESVSVQLLNVSGIESPWAYSYPALVIVVIVPGRRACGVEVAG